jgi:hypothetical protein
LSVQALPSLHAAVLFTCMHTPLTQMSFVQMLLSLHGMSVPRHTPLTHTSFTVHGSPSSHTELLNMNVHPTAATHVAVVQTSLSSGHCTGVPMHTPFTQVSLIVQALLSLHAAPFDGVNMHPVTELHESVVQGLLSLQTVGGPPMHTPPEHVSPVVHGFPSLQLALLGVCRHIPVAASHVSVVQGFPSLQFNGVPAHTPFEHVSLIVHGFPSSHAAVLNTKVHPTPCTHVAVVQTLLSSGHCTGVPTHTPFMHSPFTTHEPPPPHAVLFGTGVNTHPAAGSHESVVHGFPSSHTRGTNMHAPFTHWSSVHASPSSQSPSAQHGTQPGSATCTHTPLQQTSCVHGFPSSQSIGTPPHTPLPKQMSSVVHGSPSSQGVSEGQHSVAQFSSTFVMSAKFTRPSSFASPGQSAAPRPAGPAPGRAATSPAKAVSAAMPAHTGSREQRIMRTPPKGPPTPRHNHDVQTPRTPAKTDYRLVDRPAIVDRATSAPGRRPRTSLPEEPEAGESARTPRRFPPTGSAPRTRPSPGCTPSPEGS